MFNEFLYNIYFVGVVKVRNLYLD